MGPQDVTTEAIFFMKMVSLAVCDDVALSLTEPIDDRTHDRTVFICLTTLFTNNQLQDKY